MSAVKLRGGWGQIGNQNIPSFAYADVVSTYDTWVYGFNSGLNLLKAYASTSKGNKDIKWETVEQGNIGVDLGFFKNSFPLGYVNAESVTGNGRLSYNPVGECRFRRKPGFGIFDRVSREGRRLPLFCERKLYFPKK